MLTTAKGGWRKLDPQGLEEWLGNAPCFDISKIGAEGGI